MKTLYFIILLYLISQSGASILQDYDLTKLRAEYEKATTVALNQEQYENTLENVLKQLSQLPQNTTDTTFSSLSWFKVEDSTSTSLKICLVCTSFEGLTLNSGIGTFTTALAHLLVQQGHTVTVLYARSDPPQTQTMKYWMEFYQNKGINLVPLRTQLKHYLSAPYLQARSYEAYLYLRQREFDVIHFPDFEGLGYYSTLAKKEGLSFQDTLLVVGLHGTTRWVISQNTGHDHLVDPTSLEVDFMEQKSVEFADALWTPSNYLVNWLVDKKWKVPANVFLLPLIPGEEVKNIAKTPSSHENFQVDEIVFFGRLEPRKGLNLFCDAVDTLATTYHKPLTVTFLGTPVDLEGGEDSVSYINERSSTWDFSVKILTTFDRESSLQYLRTSGRIAVIPSLQDNAPYTVYESLYLGIPFIASNIDSISSLITQSDKNKVLFEPAASSLFNKLEEVLSEGSRYATGVFSISEAENRWKGFYSYISTISRSTSQQLAESTPLVSVCITHYNRPEFLEQAIDSVKLQDYSNYELILVDDGSTLPEALRFLDSIETEFNERGWKIIRTENKYLGAARNRAAREAKGEYLVFLDDDNYAKPAQLSTYVKVALKTGAEILTAAHDVFVSMSLPMEENIEQRWIPLGSSIAVGLFKNCFGDANFFVKKSSFFEIGGFTEEYNVGLEDHEFHAKAALTGHTQLVIPESLLYYRMHDKVNQMLFKTDQLTNLLRRARPYSMVLRENSNELLKVLANINKNGDKLYNIVGLEIDGRKRQSCNESFTAVQPGKLGIVDFGSTAELIFVGSGFEAVGSCPGVVEAKVAGLACEVTDVTKLSFTCNLDPTVLTQLPLGVRLTATVTMSTLFTVVNAVELYDASPNEVVSATYQSSGTSIKVVLKHSTNRGGLTGSFACSSLFAVVGGNSKLGTGSSCSWIDSKTLIIKTGSGTTLNYDTTNSIVVSETLQWNTLNVVEPAFSTQEFVLAAPTSAEAPTPVVTISGPTSVAVCASLPLTASFTGTFGRNALTKVEWRDSSSGTPLDTALQTKTSELITLAATDLPSGTTVIKATVTNWVGNAATAEFTFSKSGNTFLPTVTVQGALTRKITRRDTLTLKGFASPSTCVESDTLKVRWSSGDGSMSSNTDTLIIPPNTLHPVNDYTFTFTAESKQSPGTTASTTVVVSVQRSALIGSIRGGSRTIGLDPAEVSLIADGVDPDSPATQFSYVWSCSILGVVVGSDCGLTLQNTREVTFNTQDMKEAKYEFTVVISHSGSGRSVTAKAVVTTVPGSPPLIGIQSVNQPVDPTKKLTLTASHLGGPEVESWTWSVTEGDAITSDSNNFLTALNKRSITIKPNVLTPGATYTFTVTANSVAASSGSASITIVVNEPPSGGTISVEPSTGVALETMFTIRTFGWDADASTYGFLQQKDGETRFTALSGITASPTVKVVLPTGNWTLFAEVYDEYGAKAVVSTTVEVTAPATTDPEELLTNGLAHIEATGDTNALGAVIETASSLITEETPEEVVLDAKLQMAHQIRTLANSTLNAETVNAIIAMVLNIIDSPGSISFEILEILTTALENIIDAAVGGAFRASDVSDFFGVVLRIGNKATAILNANPTPAGDELIARLTTALGRVSGVAMTTIAPGETTTSVEPESGAQVTLTKSSVEEASNQNITAGTGEVEMNIPSGFYSALPPGVENVGFSSVVYEENPFAGVEETKIFGNVFTLSAYGDDGEPLTVSGLDPPAKFTLHFDPALTAEQMDRVSCSYFDEAALSWSTDGCTVEFVTAFDVVCACTHFTAFGVAEVQETDVAVEPPAEESPSRGGTDNTSLILGVVFGVVGAMIIVGLVVGGIVFGRRRQRRRRIVPLPQAQAEAEPDKDEAEKDPDQLPPLKISPKTAWAETQPKKTKEEEEAVNAATKIQSVYRGYTARRSTRRQLLEEYRRKSEMESLKLPSIKSTSSQQAWEDEEKKLREEDEAAEREREAQRERELEEEKLRLERELKEREDREREEKERNRHDEKKKRRRSARRIKKAFEEGSEPVAKPEATPAPAVPEYGPEHHEAATKIQRAFRRYLASQDIQREEEIEQLLLDIDELLSTDL